jgi:FKBP-type peptidyl-prolyl cis-trans isomerase (trigger factor)
MIEEFKDNIAQMGLEMEVYLKNIKKTQEELEREWLPKACERAQAGLVLRKIADKETIEVSADEKEQEMNKLIKHYPDWEKVKDQIDMAQLLEYTKGRLINEKVFKLLEDF